MYVTCSSVWPIGNFTAGALAEVIGAHWLYSDAASSCLSGGASPESQELARAVRPVYSGRESSGNRGVGCGPEQPIERKIGHLFFMKNVRPCRLSCRAADSRLCAECLKVLHGPRIRARTEGPARSPARQGLLGAQDGQWTIEAAHIQILVERYHLAAGTRNAETIYQSVSPMEPRSRVLSECPLHAP